MNTKKKGNVVNFYKIFIIQAYGYLAFIPFLFASFTLIKKHNTVDIIIFIVGIFFLSVLLLMNHLEPSVKITPLRIILFSIDRNRPIILQRKDLTRIERVNNRLVILHFGDSNYQIRFNKNKLNKLVKILEETD